MYISKEYYSLILVPLQWKWFELQIVRDLKHTQDTLNNLIDTISSTGNTGKTTKATHANKTKSEYLILSTALGCTPYAETTKYYLLMP